MLADARQNWPDFTANWPNTGPAGTVDAFQTMGPWPIPTINTALLLTSGLTLTWAHHALIANKRSQLIWGLGLTVLLGAIFMGFQAYEYVHAYRDLNLTLGSGIYGSTFFMLTGMTDRTRTPRDVEGLWERMYAGSAMTGRRGLGNRPEQCDRRTAALGSVVRRDAGDG